MDNTKENIEKEAGIGDMVSGGMLAALLAVLGYKFFSRGTPTSQTGSPNLDRLLMYSDSPMESRNSQMDAEVARYVVNTSREAAQTGNKALGRMAADKAVDYLTSRPLDKMDQRVKDVYGRALIDNMNTYGGKDSYKFRNLIALQDRFIRESKSENLSALAPQMLEQRIKAFSRQGNEKEVYGTASKALQLYASRPDLVKGEVGATTVNRIYDVIKKADAPAGEKYNMRKLYGSIFSKNKAFSTDSAGARDHIMDLVTKSKPEEVARLFKKYPGVMANLKPGDVGESALAKSMLDKIQGAMDAGGDRKTLMGAKLTMTGILKQLSSRDARRKADREHPAYGLSKFIFNPIDSAIGGLYRKGVGALDETWTGAGLAAGESLKPLISGVSNTLGAIGAGREDAISESNIAKTKSIRDLKDLQEGMQGARREGFSSLSDMITGAGESLDEGFKVKSTPAWAIEAAEDRKRRGY